MTEPTDSLMTKSPWQEQVDALPSWAQKMVSALVGAASYGGMRPDMLSITMSAAEKYTTFHVTLRNESFGQWFEGFVDMRDLAAALTAPWPLPEVAERERRRVNLVEMAADEEEAECAFDQPCCFGHRVNGHAVYCHNEAWPEAPTKCHRNRTNYLHEKCPGFVANPEYQKASHQT